MSFITQPVDIAFANSPMLYDVYNANYNQTDFKYGLEVYIWTGEKSSPPASANYTLSKQPNSASKAVFDISRLVREFIRVQHPKDLTATLNPAINDIVWVQCTATFTWTGGSATDVDSNIVLATRGYSFYEDGKVNYDNRSNLGNSFASAFATYVTEDNGRIEGTSCIASELETPYEYIYSRGGYLPTYSPLKYKTFANGLLTIALFTDYVDSIVITDDNGNSTTIAVSTGTTSESKLKYLNCSPNKIQLLGLDYTDSYTITASKNAIQYADTYTIEVLCESKYEPMQLCYLNKMGVWDYFTFFKRSNESISTTKTSYMKSGLDLGTSSTAVSYNQEAGELGTFLSNGYRTFTLNSGFVAEKEGERIEQLMLSEKVILNTKQTTYRVEVTDNGKSIQKSTNEKLINYTITIKDGHRRINKVDS